MAQGGAGHAEGEAARRPGGEETSAIAARLEAYKALLAEAGFKHVSVEITRRYTAVQAGLDPATLPAGWEGGDGKLASAFVRATKPRSAVPASLHPRGTRCCQPPGR